LLRVLLEGGEGVFDLRENDGLSACVNLDNLEGFFAFSSASCVSGVGGDRTRLGTDTGGVIVGSS
jgi:hypothetical protein